MVKHGILHVHSMHSENDSTMKPETIIKKAKAMGCEHITLTDHGTMSGLEAFMAAGKKYGVNAIPGVETYLEERRHLILVAKDYEGYISIGKAMKDANENLYVKKIGNKDKEFPIMTKEVIAHYFKDNPHVFATSACMNGPLAAILLKRIYAQKTQKKKMDKAKELEQDYLHYKGLNQAVSNLESKILGLKEQKISFKPFTTAAYQKKMNACRSENYSLFGDPEEEYEKMLKDREYAEEQIFLIDQELEYLTEEKKRLSRQRSGLKEKQKRYLAAKQDAESVLIPEESELYQEVLEEAKWYQSIFPEFYIELQYHGLKEEAYIAPILTRVAKKLQIPVIAANDAHMAEKTDDCIQARQIVRFNYFSKHEEISRADRELYLKQDEELFYALTKVVDAEIANQALENTRVLESCKIVIPEEKHYPRVRENFSFRGLLEEKRSQMIQKGQWDDTYQQRMEHEISVITSMGFVDYHLIVYQLCNMIRTLGTVPKDRLNQMPLDYKKIPAWIEKNGFHTGIGIGPGRGSAGGSLVCYMLGITNIDPIKYDLLFERFLNPERVSMPDIDTDIKTSLRPYMIQILRNLFGGNAVCSIMTENAYNAKGAVKLAARDRGDEIAKDLPKKEAKTKKAAYTDLGQKLADLIPAKATMESAEPVFLESYGNNPEAVLIWKRAKLLMGVLYSKGLHAGGVVISDNDDLSDYIPLAWNSENNVWAAQMDMVELEKRGLLKIDLLGLNTLDVLSDAVHLIKKHRNLEIQLDELPFLPEVFEEIFAKGNTNSIFQFESAGMKNTLRDFKPKTIEDVILLNAAYRPGPMDFIPEIIKVKNGEKKPHYIVPQLEPILKSTYGSIIYQEQVMRIVRDLAGYTLGRSDLVRRAMSKKKSEIMERERKNFVYGNPEEKVPGCIANGISETDANKIYDSMIDFAKYAFNKSHAAAYAVLAYQTAYLKYYYKEEFLCSLFRNKEQDKFGPILEDCKAFGVKLLPFDINKSEYDFNVEGRSIRYGFSGVKGFAGRDSIDKFVEERKNHGVYTSVENFICRNQGNQILNSANMEALINIGSFDCFCKDRKALSAAYAEYLKCAKNTDSLLLLNDFYKGAEICEKSRNYNITKEADYLGTILSEDPLENIDEDASCTSFADIEESNEKIKLLGFITKYEEKVSRNGNPMIKADFTGKGGTCTLLICGKKYHKYKASIQDMMYQPFYVMVRNGFVDEFQDACAKEYVITLDRKEVYAAFVKSCLQDQGEKEIQIKVINYFPLDGSRMKCSQMLISKELFYDRRFCFQTVKSCGQPK